ncbi:hypothetical protein ABVT39_022080 [Epinephelus coioides]
MSRSLWDKVARQHSQADVTAQFITLSRCTPVELWLIDQLTQVSISVNHASQLQDIIS